MKIPSLFYSDVWAKKKIPLLATYLSQKKADPFNNIGFCGEGEADSFIDPCLLLGFGMDIS